MICEDVMCRSVEICVLALIISLGKSTVAEQQPVIAPIANGFNRLGGPSSILPSLFVSGKARFNAALTPKAIQFSNTIPPAVGTAPFQNAATPYNENFETKVLKRREKKG
jgi:hypothetical protein